MSVNAGSPPQPFLIRDLLLSGLVWMIPASLIEQLTVCPPQRDIEVHWCVEYATVQRID